MGPTCHTKEVYLRLDHVNRVTDLMRMSALECVHLTHLVTPLFLPSSFPSSLRSGKERKFRKEIREEKRERR